MLKSPQYMHRHTFLLDCAWQSSPCTSTSLRPRHWHADERYHQWFYTMSARWWLLADRPDEVASTVPDRFAESKSAPAQEGESSLGQQLGEGHMSDMWAISLCIRVLLPCVRGLSMKHCNKLISSYKQTSSIPFLLLRLNSILPIYPQTHHILSPASSEFVQNQRTMLRSPSRIRSKAPSMTTA